MIKIYLDDIRTPIEDGWEIVRNYKDFVDLIEKTGLENIEKISLDHDLGETAIGEYFNNVIPNSRIDYSNIEEKTGYDCTKWLVDHYQNNNKVRFPEVLVHSANPVGSKNITSYINNFLKHIGQEENCYRVQIPHK
jgi:hypothetical protein